jgi:hypothetical protein
MRVLVATDAWDPQVNGVVFSLKKIAREVPRHGMEISFVTPSDFATMALPTYPGHPVGGGNCDGVCKPIPTRRNRSHPHRDRRPDRMGGTILLHVNEAYLHNELPHALSKICGRPFSDSGEPQLCAGQDASKNAATRAQAGRSTGQSGQALLRSY